MENSAQSNLNNPTPATNEHSGREGSEFKKSFRIIAVVVFVAIVLVVGFLTALALSLLVKQPDDGSLKVGDTTITKATIDQYASGMKEFSDSHPEQNFGNDDFNQIARDDLIMNAALKQHAKACNASVSDKDVLTQAGYGNEPVESIDSLLGNKGDFRRIRNENEAYQSKMEQCIIAHKEIFSVRVFFNSPYFTSLPNQSAQGAFDAAKKRLEDEFLPLFKKKLSKEDIAAKADINYLDDIANEDEEYRIFSTTPAVTTSLEKYTSGFYNDLDVDYVANPGKLYTMESIANELNKVGDYIGVRATKISAFVIARLESKSPGTYKSWDDFLAKVKKDNGIETESSASKAVRAVGSAISDVFGALGDILPRTENVSAAGDCHLAHFHYYAKDTATGANLSVSIHMTRAHAGCTGKAINQSGNTPISFDIDCNGPGPYVGGGHWANFVPTAPSGYTYSHKTDDLGFVWGGGNVNANQGNTIIYYFTPDKPPDSWALTPSISVSPKTVEPGQSVTFTSSIKNNGSTKSSSNYTVTGHVSRSGSANINGGATQNNGSNSYTAKVSDIGTSTICATISVAPKAHNNSGSATAQACASVGKPYHDSDPGSGSNSGSVEVTNTTSGGSGSGSNIIIAKPFDTVRWDYTMQVGTLLPRPSSYIASVYPDFNNDRRSPSNAFSHSCSISGSIGSLSCARTSNGTTSLNNSIMITQNHVNTNLKQTMSWSPTSSSISNPETTHTYATGSHQECSEADEEGNVSCWTVIDYTTVIAYYIQRTQSGSASASAAVHVPINYDTDVTISNSSYTDEQVFESGQTVNMGGGMTVKDINSGTHLGTYATTTRGGNYQLTLIKIDPGAENAKLRGKSNSNPCGFYGAQPGLRQCKSLASGSTGDRGLGYHGNVVSGVNFTIPDDDPLGTKYCFAFSVSPAAIVNDARQETWNHSVPTCIRLGKRPKTQTHNGGVSAPGGILTTVTDRNNAINTNGSASATRGVYGSWSEYEALSVGEIKGFGSLAAFQKPVANNNATNYSKMTFGNVSPSGGTAFGYFSGGAKSAATDIVNYFYNIAKSTPSGMTYSDSTILTASSEESLFNGTGTVTIGGGTVPKGHTAIIYTTGDVNITGNIQYADTTYSSIAEIPQVVIVSKKNIRIAEGVTRVDAWLIANNESSATAGTIFTCANSGETISQVIARVKSTVCHNLLTINGPVYAEKLHLLRTAGAEPATPKDPAEVFNLPSSTYLWAYNYTNKKNLGYAVTKYSIDLPPRY